VCASAVSIRLGSAREHFVAVQTVVCQGVRGRSEVCLPRIPSVSPPASLWDANRRSPRCTLVSMLAAHRSLSESLPRPVVECIQVRGVRFAKESDFDPQKFGPATKRVLIVVATMISRIVGTPVFSDRTEFSVTTSRNAATRDRMMPVR
jgi:hypothetical protein